MKKNLKRSRRSYGSVLAAGGLMLAGTAAGVAFLSAGATDADAGEVNYVRSVSHDAVSGVRLDEELIIRFNAAVLPQSVGPDTILIRTGPNNGIQARGRYIVGKFMYDRRSQRRVVIRPEAVQEFFQLRKGLSRTDAKRKATKFIKAVERTGRFKRLRRIDKQLNATFPAGFGAGTRLDDDLPTNPIFGTFPSQVLLPDDPLAPYRQNIAGDDALWEAHFAGDPNAFPQLAANSEFERFFHTVDPATGRSDPESVLRKREYRQVLINRSRGKRVMFVPDIPIRSDLTDAGYTAASAFSVQIPTGQPGVFNTVLTKRGGRPLVQERGRDFSTLFTTVPNTGAVSLFQDNESRVGVAASQMPRVINTTPPNGESFVDPSTDWEDPDNSFLVPLPARRTFTVRIRFAQPIDPRTVNPGNILIAKTKSAPDTPGEIAFDPPIPVAAGTFLNQRRLGIVEVELTPATNLDPESQYQVTVRGLVKSLAGELLNGGLDVKTTFIVGPGDPPKPEFREDFIPGQLLQQARPTDFFTKQQITTARWGAPALYDPDGKGLLVATFMPFLGRAEGAPADPLNPVPFDPNDPDTFPVRDLVLLPPDAATITFLTEVSDPLDPNFGQQLEYEYRSVSMTSATASVLGRFPLVLRSQTAITLTNSAILANGEAGSPGRENLDTVGGGPPGGLGGGAGPGGFRGGDGAYAPQLDANDNPTVDINGDFEFDPAKTDGGDGFPSFNAAGAVLGGGGAGGFSGTREEGVNADPDGDGINNPEISPTRVSEPGGGGGHATVGGDSDRARITNNTHPAGHLGGIGGIVFGETDFSDAPLNRDFVPRLDAGMGGAGGGGGGGEDDPDVGSGSLGTIGAEDSGGGGGGGGGGGVQLVARTLLRLDASVVDVSGGDGGDTADANNADLANSAGGGGGAGGAFWAQCFGDIQVLNGSTISAGGGAGGEGTVSPDPTDDPVGSTGGLLTGFGGPGGLGIVRFEDADGVADTTGSVVLGVVTQDVFRPVDTILDVGTYPSHQNVKLAQFGNEPTDPDATGVPMVVDFSQAFSDWHNTGLDTPAVNPVFDDPLTPEDEGTAFDEGAGTVDIFMRATPNDTSNTGSPNLFLVTPWTALIDADMVSDRRFLQFRVNFTVPLSFDPETDTFPSVDTFQVNIELN